MDPTSQRQPGAVTVRPIGQVMSPRGELTDDHWGEVPAVIRLDAAVYGIKPYLREFGPRGELRQPQWSTELVRSYY
ncbi:hypothetical protein [Streptomyces sp. NRRL S-1813]|uniref:hypothetical protein n=1 Tax=Streptomyces sp. NRRL S-1813 TaxID=1463888 RepID=UPI0004CB9933|nr:hypothetical protein [Streptomyces sp. NRRL S-1813]